MRESWRWFGPNDPVTIADIRQTGATDIVSALHNIPTGQAWPLAAIHPDDPPRDMLGLPRIICTAADLDILFAALPSPANGITLCVGTYSSRPDNNLPEMAKQFGPRIHFSHLRGVSRDPQEQRSFYEASHLDSDIDMVQVVHELLLEEQRHQMMDDIGKTVNPGYSGIGRMKGLAEVRGVIRALSAQIFAVSVTNKGNQA
ncbi:MAG: mannonate dehydratase [Glaciecola sp.]